MENHGIDVKKYGFFERKWVKFFVIPFKIRLYMELLTSDKYFSEGDYSYFGKRIYYLRNVQKDL